MGMQVVTNLQQTAYPSCYGDEPDCIYTSIQKIQKSVIKRILHERNKNRMS